MYAYTCVTHHIHICLLCIFSVVSYVQKVSSTVHMPIIMFGFTVYLTSCYWALGLPNELQKFFTFAAVSLVSQLLGYSLAQMMSAAMSTPQVRKSIPCL